MATKQIAWNDGSGDYITLTYQGQGSGTIAVSSSPNDLDVARSMQLTVAAAGITRQLTVTQRAAAPAYQPLTLDVLTAGTIAWLFYDGATNEPQEGGTAIEYRKNGGSWTPMSTGTSLQVLQGDRLEFRGSSSAYGSMVDDSWVSYHGFASTANVDIRGHICSLIGGGSTITADNTFYRLFSKAKVVSASDLILADNVTRHCYDGLFRECLTLITPPSVLPATVLVEYCYYRMFYACSYMTVAPELPAKELVASCYDYMFNSCNRLNYIKVKCTTKPSSTYSNRWLGMVASSGTFVKTGSWSVTRSVSCVPSGWTVNTVSS